MKVRLTKVACIPRYVWSVEWIYWLCQARYHTPPALPHQAPMWVWSAYLSPICGSMGATVGMHSSMPMSKARHCATQATGPGSRDLPRLLPTINHSTHHPTAPVCCLSPYAWSLHNKLFYNLSMLRLFCPILCRYCSMAPSKCPFKMTPLD